MQLNFLQITAIYLLLGGLFSMLYTGLSFKHRKEDIQDDLFESVVFIVKVVTILFWPFVIFCEFKFLFTSIRNEIIERIVAYKAKRALVKILKRILKDDPENEYVREQLNKLK